VIARIGAHSRVLITALLVAAGGGLSASPALASQGAATNKASARPASTTTTPPPPPPVQAAARIDLGHVLVFHHTVVSVPGRVIHITGMVSAYEPGQFLAIRLQRGNRLLHRRVVELKWRPGGKGYFSVRLRSQVSGAIRILVIHKATVQMARFVAQRRMEVMDDRVSFGARGQFVTWLQHRLWVMHFYVPQTGVYDYGTGLALDAYHRLMRWGTSRTLDGRTIQFLFNGWGAYRVRHPDHGRHAEADLSRQLLVLIDGSHVRAIFPISSGKPSTPTILGDYRIYYRTPGYNSEGMYYASYFIRGYAIHGYDPAPDYPASHGCLRLDISDAVWVYNWLGMGDWVDVYQ
jgi:hypothetical protein